MTRPLRALARDGVDWPAEEEARLRAEVAAREQAEREDGLTVEKALREYVEKKRRAKDGLALKARTKADYLAMVEAGKVSKAGRKFADGELYPIAHQLLSKLTADDIRRRTARCHVDARKTLAWTNALAGTNVQGHGLRATFASIAEELVSGGALKRMLNRATGGDVTLGHHVGKCEAQLRPAWQTVADFIDEAGPDTDRVPFAPRPSVARGKDSGASNAQVQGDIATLPAAAKRGGRINRRAAAV